MTLDKVKDLVYASIDKPKKFKVNGSRNQTLEFSGKITDVYHSVFIIKLEDEKQIKSFAYTDVLIGNLEIKD